MTAEFKSVQLKRSTTTGIAPDAGQLVDGEMAINLADKKLYSKNSSGVFQVLGGIDDNSVDYIKLTVAAKNAINTQVAAYLGTIATQNANAVNITGGNISDTTIKGGSVSGITDLSVNDGGTGSSALTLNSVMLGNGTDPLANNMVAPGAAGNVLRSDGTKWVSSSDIDWNVTYTNVTINENSAYTLPANCIQVNGYITTGVFGNTGGMAKLDVRDSSTTVLGTVYDGSSSGNDGGGGANWDIPVSIPISTNAKDIYLSRPSGGNAVTFVITSYVTK